MRISETSRVKALAYLKIGKKPREICDTLVEELSYAQVLELRKQLQVAEKDDAVRELFNLEQAALESVLRMAENDLAIVGEVIPPSDINEAVKKVGDGAVGLGKLEEQFQDAAAALVQNIKVAAITAENASTLVDLADALSKLNSSFFAKGANVQINNLNAEVFQKYLKD